MWATLMNVLCVCIFVLDPRNTQISIRCCSAMCASLSKRSIHRPVCIEIRFSERVRARPKDWYAEWRL
ncbi:uncharacterized protein EKO05_0003755 [Ascochyta rabiei]|uniref:uncharacterized protein n=1 Tax=Didymella rabiei TaxID=5454 RepID=UPI00220D4F61|nr:uncharacterized protein EKO05_0003755 [Ascochyta rabiei]UPX13235.1 hypothetical protein EKO05_0003755 [Ascochyta rabiei]